MQIVHKGRLRKSEDLQTTDALIKLQKTAPFWDVVVKVVEYWTEQNPVDYKSYLIHLEGVKASQKKTKWTSGVGQFRGVSRDKKFGVERKHLVDFPIWIYLCLKKLYPNRDLNSKEFFREFGDKFPIFRVFERV